MVILIVKGLAQAVVFLLLRIIEVNLNVFELIKDFEKRRRREMERVKIYSREEIMRFQSLEVQPVLCPSRAESLCRIEFEHSGDQVFGFRREVTRELVVDFQDLLKHVELIGRPKRSRAT
jgi:hypothetical protein